MYERRDFLKNSKYRNVIPRRLMARREFRPNRDLYGMNETLTRLAIVHQMMGHQYGGPCEIDQWHFHCKPEKQ